MFARVRMVQCPMQSATERLQEAEELQKRISQLKAEVRLTFPFSRAWLDVRASPHIGLGAIMPGV
jgi:hypothetical protein